MTRDEQAIGSAAESGAVNDQGLHTPPALTSRPNFAGDLDTMLAPHPSFRTRVRGFDRFEVGNYVSWVETELLAARRASDHLAARLGLCLAELDAVRRQTAHSTSDGDPSQVSERIREILQLATDEAADLRAAGAAEAERVLAQSRADAASAAEQARNVANEILTAAADERARVDTEADQEREDSETASAQRLAQIERASRTQRESAEAAAATRLDALGQQVNDLHRQRDEAIATCRQLEKHIGEALQTLSAPVPHEAPRPAAKQYNHRSSRARAKAPTPVTSPDSGSQTGLSKPARRS